MFYLLRVNIVRECNKKVDDLNDKKNQNEIMVSVLCLTYNHEQYIKECLDGIVKQKTNFKFEVIVHDDASTDSTANIIRDYEKKYFGLFKVIYQKQNQYSKNISIMSTYLLPKVRGKYIAVCEGDDYWNDKYKLQKQVDFLEKHKDYVACVHNTLVINCRTKEKYKKLENIKDQTLLTEQIIENGVKEFHTSSLLYRTEYSRIPDELKLSFCGDYSKALYLALCGKIYRFKDVMSVYRFFSKNSFSERTEKMNSVDVIKRYKEVQEFLKQIDIYSHYKYHSIIESLIEKNQITVYMIQYDYKKILQNYRAYVNKMSKKEKIKFYIKVILGKKVYYFSMIRLYLTEKGESVKWIKIH